MATEDLSRILRVPAKLVLTPTSFAGSFPFGGTQLGATKDVVVRPGRKHRVLRSEEYGAEAVEVLALGEACTIAAALRGWDDAALGAVFTATSTGTASRRKLVDYPGSSVPGTTLGSGATGLLVAADDYLRLPSVYFPKAVILMEESTSLTFALAEEGVVGLLAYALRRASDARAYQVGLLRDLTV